MKLLPVAAILGFLFCSCAPSTPQARIASNPTAFDELNKKHQELVSQGRITSGMSQKAVEFAWGVPDQRFQGYRNSKTTERWDYFGSRPVYSNQFVGGFGGFGPWGGFGRFGSYGQFGYPGFADFGYGGFGPEVIFVPYRAATVEFLNNRVSSWERTR